MTIGLVDVDKTRFPNIALGKIAAYHKLKGDTVEWVEPMYWDYDLVYQSFVWDIKSYGSFRLKDVVFCPDIKRFRSVIIDESHRVKDPSTQQSIFAKGITSGKPYIVLLSGTPVVNRPHDLVAQLSIMERLSEFGGRGKFPLTGESRR